MRKIPIIHDKDLNSLIEQALKNDGVLATPKELNQMLIDLPGISINSKKRKDGRYQGYIIENGIKYYIYGRSLEEVRFKIREYVKNGMPKKRPRQRKTPLLSEWAKKWLELYKKPNLKPSTYQSLIYALKPALAAFEGKMIGDITTDDLQAFLLSMTAERMRDMTQAALKQLFEKAKKQGIIKANPCDGVEIKAHVKKHKNALTTTEQSILIENVKGKALEPIFWLLLTTGIRVGEALALRADDVDFNEQTISINKNVVFIENKRIEQDTPKTSAGVRVVPVPGRVLDYLKGKSGILFPISYNSVRLAFKRLSKATGIEVSAHILRHTYSTRLEEAGISAKVRQYLLGHATLEMTEKVYTDVQKGYIDTLSGRIKSAFD